MKHNSDFWLGLVGRRMVVGEIKPIAVYSDLYNGGKVFLLALSDEWAIVQWPHRGYVRKQRRSYLESAKFKKL